MGGAVTRRAAAGLLAGALGLLLLVAGCGCGGGQRDGGRGAVRLSVWSTMTEREGEVFRRIINDYMIENPAVTVEIDQVPFEQARSRFEQGAKNGVVPDVLRADRMWIKPFARDDLIQSLTALEPLKDEIADMIPAGRESAMIGDELMAIPQEVDCLALLYNKAHFSAANVTVPEDLDQLREVAAKLTRKDQGRFGLMIQPTAWWFEPLLFGFGGQYFDAAGKFDFGTDQTRKAVHFLLELKEQGVLPPLNLREKAYAIMMEGFKNGTVSMIFNGPWAVSEILTGPAFKGDENALGVARIPKGPRGSFSPLGGQSFVIPKGAAHPREALALIKHLYKPETLRLMALQTYMLPPRKSLYADTQIKNHPIVAAFLWQLQENRIPDPHPRQARLYEMVDRFLLRVMNGEVKVDDGLRDLENAWNQ